MDKAKLRLFAAASGVLFGFVGFVALGVALVVVLTEMMGLAAAVSTVAAGFLVISIGCFYFFLLPMKSYDEEVEQLEQASADALADLPIDTVKSFISKRPVTAASIAIVLGYSLVKDPAAAGRHVQRAFFSLL